MLRDPTGSVGSTCGKRAPFSQSQDLRLLNGSPVKRQATEHQRISETEDAQHPRCWQSRATVRIVRMPHHRFRAPAALCSQPMRCRCFAFQRTLISSTRTSWSRPRNCPTSCDACGAGSVCSSPSPAKSSDRRRGGKRPRRLTIRVGAEVGAAAHSELPASQRGRSQGRRRSRASPEWAAGIWLSPSSGPSTSPGPSTSRPLADWPPPSGLG